LPAERLVDWCWLGVRRRHKSLSEAVDAVDKPNGWHGFGEITGTWIVVGAVCRKIGNSPLTASSRVEASASEQVAICFSMRLTRAFLDHRDGCSQPNDLFVRKRVVGLSFVSMAKHSASILELARRGAEPRYQELRAELNALVRQFPDLTRGPRIDPTRPPCRERSRPGDAAAQAKADVGGGAQGGLRAHEEVLH
jgi:hypothetical protein